MNSKEYRYQLESRSLTGRRQQKARCPQCGRRSLVRYVDTTRGFQYVDNTVGRCDHELSCGYHLKPSDFYGDHPWMGQTQAAKLPPPPPPRPFLPLRWEYVERSHSPRSIFWQWFSQVFAPLKGVSQDVVSHLFGEYRIGATREGHVIFWQIDRRQRVHGGHIMSYTADGHRNGYQGWTHIPLIHSGLLPLDYQLQQCLFGEHLLAKYPERTVCLVESEKTALVMAALQPRHLWLATSGSGGLNAEKMAPLRGCRLVVFPDSGCYQKWKTRLEAVKGLDFSISDRLEQYPPNTDLADLVMP